MLRQNQTRFRHSEGFELMIRTIKVSFVLVCCIPCTIFGVASVNFWGRSQSRQQHAVIVLFQEKKYARRCALKVGGLRKAVFTYFSVHLQVLNYAVAGSSSNAQRLVDAKGLKTLFPLFMGRGLGRIGKLKGRYECPLDHFGSKYWYGKWRINVCFGWCFGCIGKASATWVRLLLWRTKRMFSLLWLL
jgi:hypothetical protein